MNIDFKQLLEQIQKAGFGFTLGAGIGGLILMFMKTQYPTISIEANVYFYTFGIIGLGLNQFIDKFLIKPIVKPIANRLQFYARLLELLFLKHYKVISDDKFKGIAETLILRRFLNQDSLPMNLNKTEEDKKGVSISNIVDVKASSEKVQNETKVIKQEDKNTQTDEDKLELQDKEKLKEKEIEKIPR